MATDKEQENEKKQELTKEKGKKKEKKEKKEMKVNVKEKVKETRRGSVSEKHLQPMLKNQNLLSIEVEKEVESDDSFLSLSD